MDSFFILQGFIEEQAIQIGRPKTQTAHYICAMKYIHNVIELAPCMIELTDLYQNLSFADLLPPPVWFLTTSKTLYCKLKKEILK